MVAQPVAAVVVDAVNAAGAVGALRAMKAPDARVLQVGFLGTFLLIGVLARDFTVAPLQVAATFAAALATQVLWLRALSLRRAGVLSAIVTSLGLSLLVRADSWWVHPLLASIAISSKFVLTRADGPGRRRHVFNPANLGAVLAAFVVPGAWVSPGQWGQHVLVAAWIVALGSVVCRRAARLDIGLVFLAWYLGLLGARALALGQPAAVFAHQVNNGALLLFAFFMISDPMTTPRAPLARVLYAGVVALAAVLWQFTAYRPHGLLVALFALSPLVALLDRAFPGPAFAWHPGELGRMPAR